MKIKRKYLNTFLVSCSLLIFFPLAGCMITLFATGATNNLIFHKFTYDLYNVELPSNTIELDRFKDFGLFACGNHCDFFAGRLLKTSLSQKEIEDHFSNFQLKSVKNGENVPILNTLMGSERYEDTPIEFVWLSEDEFYRITQKEYPPYEFPEPIFYWLKDHINRDDLFKDEDTIFIAYTFDTDLAGLDFRCR